ncbi:MAG: DNA topoisomerase IV subunit A [Alphaproteobacteria bacterium]|nr:DNA topoisomerase IV subunit A [Alphaproteobacteria bacterium]
MTKLPTPPKDDDIRDEPLAGALGERYLAYALSTIMHRALPDVRDGLKPVQRRIIHAMRVLGLDPNTAFKKCARVVGDVIGKFHPHGDSAVYDALVRLAQDFAQRYPLIEGQGNFGNIDGDNAAAYRYTEARMTVPATLLLEGLDEDAVDFKATYNGEEEEPVVLPAGFPNLLANGVTGIAVGMATSIPPHNVAEICEALLHLIKTPNARDETLLQYVKGPDFPTGGLIVETPEAIAEAYRTGKGGFRVRARWSREEAGARGGYQIVVTEIPYQVQKSKLIERIAMLIIEKKVPLLDDVRDESAEDVRIVLVPKSRNVEAEVLMEQLFRLSELEVRFALNMNVLDGGINPRVMSLKEVLRAYLDHRREVLGRRSRFQLQKIERRIEVLEGYLAVYLNLDKVIKIIREEDEPKPKLMAAFTLSEVQAEAILNMRLRSLRKLEEMEIRKEHAGQKKDAAALRKLLGSDELQWEKISGEVRALRDQFGPKTALGKRRSVLGTAPAIEDVPLEAMIEKEPITVICSQKGWIRAMKGHRDPAEEVSYKEGDRGKFWIRAETSDKLVLFATNGRFYTLDCSKLPGGRGMGEPVRLMIDLTEEDDIVDLFVHQPGRELLVASTTGHGFRVPEEEVLASKRGGKQIVSVPDGAEACVCAPVLGDHVALIGDNRKLLIFKLSDVPQMAKGKGVLLQRYKDGGLCDAKCFAMAEGLRDPNGRTWAKADLAECIGARGQTGRLAPKGFPKNNRLK